MGRGPKTDVLDSFQEEKQTMNMKFRISSQGGLVVTLQELVDMNRVGFKYKINHKTKDLIVLRNFLTKEINQRLRGANNGKENPAKDQKRP